MDRNTQQKNRMTRRAALRKMGFSVVSASFFPQTWIACSEKKGILVQKIRENGVLKIKINRQIYEPWAFRSFRPTPNTVSDFYKAGVRLMNQLHSGLNSTMKTPYSLYGEFWTGLNQYDYDPVDKQMAMFTENAPDAYFNIMLQLDTRDWYLKANPEYKDTFHNLVETVGYQKWREDTTEYLIATLRYFEETYGDRIFAYSLLCGRATEWFTGNFINKGDENKPDYETKESIYQRFLNDPSAKLPDPDVLMKRSDGILRDPQKDKDVIWFWKFQADIIADTILFFVHKAQHVLQHRKLIGLFFGYSIWTNNLYQCGHLSFEKVWKSPDIDMIYQPSRYGLARSFSGTSGFQSAIDSVDLNDKIAFQEIDHATNLLPKGAPSFDQQLKNDFESQMTLRREFALTRAKRIGLWWFDMYNGNFASDFFMNDISKMTKIGERLGRKKLKSNAQIAVFTDSQSVHYAPTVTTDFLRLPPETLFRIGAPYDLFSFADISNPKLPLDQYKLIIFLNAFKIAPSAKGAIENTMKNNQRTLLWIYAADYIQDKGNSVESMSKTIGMDVKLQTEESKGVTRILSHSEFAKIPDDTVYGFSPLTPNDDRSLLHTGKLPVVENAPLPSPLFYISDNEVTVVGAYDDTGNASLGFKKHTNYTSFWSATPAIPSVVYREIARFAGVHIYYEGNNPIYMNNKLLAIHLQDDTNALVRFPIKSDYLLEDLFDDKVIEMKEGEGVLTGKKGEMKFLLLKNGVFKP